MNKQSEEQVWISVGHPAIPVPYIHRTPMMVKQGHEAEAGNKLRKLCSKNPTLIGLPKEITIPAEDFYFAVFSTDGKAPLDAVIQASDNYYWKYGVREQMGDLRPDFEPYCPDFQGMLHPVQYVENAEIEARNEIAYAMISEQADRFQEQVVDEVSNES